MIADLDLHCTSTKDLRWLLASAKKAVACCPAAAEDVVALEDELATRTAR